jgi:ATP-binding cassette subfamily B (MDR/TAP) protein 1
MSGGQLQRICLARGLCRNPKLLLLDEATSALDPVTEKNIIETLEKLHRERGMTILSVSHHPETARNADQIIVLDHGIIKESGTYQKLMAEKGHFCSLVEATSS